jgi:hypothetical protein
MAYLDANLPRTGLLMGVEMPERNHGAHEVTFGATQLKPAIVRCSIWR